MPLLKPAKSKTKKNIKNNLLKTFLNVYWLRPEVALFHSISSFVIQNAPTQPFGKNSLDLGMGNGLFSFITMGGEMSPNYDVYKSLSVKGFWQKKDIYNHIETPILLQSILKKPKHSFTVGLDHKANLIKQASRLGSHQRTALADANKRWPFSDSSFGSIFSNIGYWLSDPHFLFSELNRVLKTGGQAHLALQTPSLTKMCPSYRPSDFPKYATTLHLLNRGRSECSNWRLELNDLEIIAKKNHFNLIYHRYYLTEIALKIWDIGLRPLTPVLTQMTNALKLQERKKIKAEWIEIFIKLLNPVFEAEMKEPSGGGYIYIILEKE